MIEVGPLLVPCFIFRGAYEETLPLNFFHGLKIGRRKPQMIAFNVVKVSVFIVGEYALQFNKA